MLQKSGAVSLRIHIIRSCTILLDPVKCFDRYY